MALPKRRMWGRCLDGVHPKYTAIPGLVSRLDSPHTHELTTSSPPLFALLSGGASLWFPGSFPRLRLPLRHQMKEIAQLYKRAASTTNKLYFR